MSDQEILHPDGSDCDYCTYDRPCITVTGFKTAIEVEAHLDGAAPFKGDREL